MTTFTPELLAEPIAGLRLRGPTLGAHLSAHGGGPTLLVFLRHLGCIFCREMVRDLRAVAEADPTFPPVLLFGQSDCDETAAFLGKYWPDAPAVCDPAKRFYDGVGLGRGSVWQVLGPRVWACAMRAGVKGNFQTRILGDPWILPGAFLVAPDGAVLWQHDFEHAGDHPDWSSVPRHARATTPERELSAV